MFILVLVKSWREPHKDVPAIELRCGPEQATLECSQASILLFFSKPANAYKARDPDLDASLWLVGGNPDTVVEFTLDCFALEEE